MKWLLIMLLMVAPVQAFLISVNQEQYEEQFGENLLRIRREAEILWARENLRIIHNYYTRTNYYMSSITDAGITEVFRNEKSRELNGLSEVNITPYMDRVRAGEYFSRTKKRSVRNDDRVLENTEYVVKVIEEEAKPKKIIKTMKTKEETKEESKKGACVKNYGKKSFNPLKRLNWASNLLYIKLEFQHKRAFLPGCY